MAQTPEQRVGVRTNWPTDNAGRLTVIEERERRILAGELHDQLSQILAIIKIKLTPLAAGEFQDPINEIMALIDKADHSARMVSRQLGPPILHQPGMIESLQSLAGEMQSTYGLTVHIDDEAGPVMLIAYVKAVLYRCMRELLTNVARHSGSMAANISFRCDGDQLLLAVHDEGCGFDPASVHDFPAEDERFGLRSVYERMLGLGGRLDAVSVPGHGTVVTLSLPASAAMLAPLSS